MFDAFQRHRRSCIESRRRLARFVDKLQAVQPAYWETHGDVLSYLVRLPYCPTESNKPMSLILLKTPVAAPMRQQVVDILRDAITDHLFEPGGRLTERELCESLGVSRSTVREGLRQLEAEGLVQIKPNKGPTVAELSEEEARHIYAIRAKLQGMAAAACAKNPPPDLVPALQKLLTVIRNAERAGNYRNLQAARTSFYNLIFDGSGNPQLSILLRQLRARVTLMRGLEGLREERMQEAMRGANVVLDAIRAGDTKAAARVAEEHIERAAELVFEARKAAMAKSSRRKKMPARAQHTSAAS
jgi:DNA-binding GntR family transcriptional regulator